MVNYQRDKQLWKFSDSDPIVIQLEQEHMSAEEFMKLLSRPAPKLDAILCYWHYGDSILTYWLEN